MQLLFKGKTRTRSLLLNDVEPLVSEIAQETLMASRPLGPTTPCGALRIWLTGSTLWITNSPPMPFRWVDPNANAFPYRLYGC
jgi:hypothetical protein